MREIESERERKAKKEGESFLGFCESRPRHFFFFLVIFFKQPDTEQTEVKRTVCVSSESFKREILSKTGGSMCVVCTEVRR